MEAFALRTNKTLTDIIHDAVRAYKDSPQLKADMAAHKKRLEQAEAVSDPTASKVDNAGRVQAIVKRAAARAARVQPPPK